MNKKLALFAVPVIMMAATTTKADSFWGVTPIFGADAQWRHMDFKSGYGSNIFRHNYPQGNVYVGLKFCDYLGVEAGYEATSRKSQTVTLVTPVTVVGTLVNTNNGRLNSVEYTTTARIKGPHINLVGYLPICDAYRIQLIGSVGLANLQISLRRQITAINNIPDSLDAPSEYSARKSVLRLVGGIQHYITDCIGVRATVGWENTRRLRNVLSTSRGIVTTVQPKNSVNYGAGVFVTF